MRNKYLFFINEEVEKKERIMGPIDETYLKNMGVSCVSSTIDEERVWIVSFLTEGNSEDDAKKISQIDKSIISFKPLVLENGASAYFNKRLYPLVNDFERLLRELLYLILSQDPTDQKYEKINDLESKDFGTIYKELFVDKDYMNSMKEFFNKTAQWSISKAEMEYKTKYIEEKTPWMQFNQSEELLTIQNSFFSIKEYRNDVMHAHNINYEDYVKIKNLFEKSNIILHNEIEKIYKNHNVSSLLVQSFSKYYDDIISSTMKQKSAGLTLEEIGKHINELIVNLQSALPSEKKEE